MQQKMADYQQPAPEVSWDALDKALASNRRKAKTIPMWMRRIAAAAVALVAVTGGYLAFHQNHGDRSLDSDGKAMNHGPVPMIQAAEEPKTAEPQQTNVKPATLLAQNRRSTHVIQEEGLVRVSHGDRHLGKPQEPVPMTQQSPVQEMQASQESQEPQETKTVVATVKRQTLDEPYEIRKQKAPENRLTAMVYLSNGLSGDNLRANTESYKYKDLADNYRTEPDVNKNHGEDAQLSCDSPGEGNNDPSTSTPDYGSNPPSYTTKTGLREESVNHRLPIRLGLSLRYRLNDRWSLESGLAYTRLRSNINYRLRSDINNNNDIRTNTEQTLSYIGIPVTASYLLTSGRYVNLYVSAGGMVEKMVKGQQHYEYVEKNLEHTESVSIRPLQFSVNGGLGVEFNLSHLFSLYAEPGVGYYFDNGSSIPTYYQDKPFSFNLNLGIRLNIK